MSDMFEGGFFEEAEVDVHSIPDDPFGFGNDYWPIRIIEVGDPKVTQGGDKIGMMVKWVVDHPNYHNHYVGKTGLGNGQWFQLPVPVKLRGEIPWDPQSDDAKNVTYKLGKLYEALGFPKDRWAKVNKGLLIGAGCLTKIKPVMGDSGFWEFRFNGMKPFPAEGSAQGYGEFAQPGNSNSGGKSEEELLRDELNGA